MRIGRLAVILLLAGGCSRVNHEHTTPPPPDLLTAPRPLALAEATLADATVGVAYEALLQVTGDHAGVAQWTIGGAGLPPGLALDSTVGPSVRLIGTPTTTGSYTFAVAVRDSFGETDSRMLTLVVGDGLAIAGALPGAVEGQPFDATLSAKGGHGKTFTWSVGSGALPAGITLTPHGDSVELSGTPAAGTANFVLALDDDAGEHATRTISLAVPSSLVLSHGVTPQPMQGTSVSVPLTVTGGIAPYHWTLGGASPPGLALAQTSSNATTLAGVVTAAGSYSFSVTVSDDNQGTASANLSLTVLPALHVVTDHVADGQVGKSYLASVSAVGGASGTYQWTVTSGALPPGLTLATAAGAAPPATLSGTPTQAGAYSFTLTVATPEGDSASASFTMTVAINPPHITTTSLLDATWSTSYVGAIAGVTAASGTISWRIVAGTLPPGLSLAASTSTIVELMGTPLVVGTFTFTVQMSDSNGSDEKQLTLTVDRLAGLEVLGAILPRGRVGQPYSATVDSRGAGGTVTWSVANGALPDGLTLAGSGTSATLSGTPTTSGWFPFTLHASDSSGSADSRAFAIGVSPARMYFAGETYAYVNSYSSTVTLREIEARSPGAETVLVSNAASTSVFTPQFSPAGDFVTYDLANQSANVPIFSADLRGDTPTSPQLLGNFWNSPLWSPDDRRALSWVSLPAPQGFDLDVDDFSGATPAVTQIDPSAANSPAAWSSDGTRLAYWSLDNRTLNVYGKSGTVAIALPASLSNGSFLYGPNPWLPDGSGLVFWGQANPQDLGRLFYIDAASGAVPFALTDAGMNVPNGTVNASPDGGSVAFLGATASDGTTDVWYLDLRSRQRSLPTKANGTVKRAFNPPLWSPDSRVLLLASPFETLAPTLPPLAIARDQIGAADPTALAIGSLGPAAYDVQWAADSAHVLYSAELIGLYELSLDGSAPVLLSTNVGLSYGSVSSRRRAYVFANSVGLNYVTVSNGVASAPVQIDVGDANTETVQVSLALESVFYSAQSKAVYIADLSGSTPAAPAQLLPSGPNWSFFAITP